MNLPQPHNLKNTTLSPIRLGLQGAPGSGKTWAALTFPNPIVADFDNKLGAHAGKDIIVYPFWDPTWELLATGNFKAKGPTKEPARAEAFSWWIKSVAIDFAKDSTLIVDSMTKLEAAWEITTDENPPRTKELAIDTRAYYRSKLEFFRKLHTNLKALKCNLVVTFHEQVLRTESGAVTGRVKPLLAGQFADRVGQDYTDWYRQVADKEGYWWMLKPNNACECWTTIDSTKVPEKIPANYNELAKLINLQKQEK